jgi:hypothetical protein
MDKVVTLFWRFLKKGFKADQPQVFPRQEDTSEKFQKYLVVLQAHVGQGKRKVKGEG